MTKNLINSTLLLALLIALLSVGCQSPTTPLEDQMSELPQDFLDFFERFHKDSAFQMESIQFPLEGKKIEPDSTVDEANDGLWYPEKWVMHKPYKDEEGYFDREYEAFSSHLIVEYIRLKGGKIGMERRFAKLGDQWKLIYYASLNILQSESSNEEEERDASELEDLD